MLYLIILISIIAIVFAFLIRKKILLMPTNDSRAEAISQAILEHSKAYLKRQFRVVSYIAVILFAVLLIFLNWKTALGFLIGAIASGFAGYFGMLTAVKSNIRVAESAKNGLAGAFK